MKKLLYCLFVIMIILTGCTGDNSEGETVQTVEASEEPVEAVLTPVQGGTLRLSMRAPKTLNPLLNEDVTVDNILKLLFEPVVTLDESQKPTPNLAEFSFAPDGMSVLLTIREDAKWSDGLPVVADDIIFSLDTLRKASDTVVYKESVKNIVSFSSTDDHSIRIQYSQPFGGAAYLLCFPVIPMHYYLGEPDPSSEKNMKPVGSGLYQYTDYMNMKEMTLSSNSYSYRKKPYIENISVLITPDKESDIYALDQNQIDMVSAQISDWGKYRSTKEANITEYITSYYDFIGFNFNNELLSDKKIRTAIAYSINIDDMIDSIYLSHGMKTMTPINPEAWIYEPETMRYEYDTEASKRNINTAGYNLSKDGVMVKDVNGTMVNLYFRILVNEENSERVKIARILKENLSAVGIETEINSVPYEEYEEKLTTGDFDIFVGGFNLSVIPDLTFAFHSSQIGVRNYFSYEDETMDSLLKEVFSATSETAFKKTLSNLQKYIADELPCISLVFRKSAVITDKGVMGDIKPVKNNVFANINEWYMNAK